MKKKFLKTLEILAIIGFIITFLLTLGSMLLTLLSFGLIPYFGLDPRGVYFIPTIIWFLIFWVGSVVIDGDR